MAKKKKSRNLLILVLILAVCCVGYIALLKSNEAAEEETTAAEDLEALMELGEDVSIVSLSYEQEGEAIDLVYSDADEAWQRSGAADFPVDTSTVSSMVSTLTSADILRVINEDGSDLDEYGLENPVYTVTVTDSEGNATVFLIGDDNSLAGGCYVMIDGSSRVVLTDSALATCFNYGWYDLASVDEAPGIDDSEVDDITVTQGDVTTVLEYDADGKSDVDATGDTKLFVKTEDGYQAISSDYEDDILDGVEDFAYTALAAWQPGEEELASYGLDDPTAVIVVNYTTEEEVEVESDGDSTEDSDEETETETVIEHHTYTLTVGAYDEENALYYVQHDDSSSVFTMSADAVSSLLDMDTSQMVRLDPTNVDEDTIDSFEVTCGGTTLTYAIERDVVVETEEETTEAEETSEETAESEETEEETVTTTDLYTLNGEDIEESEYTTALSAITGLDGVRLLAEGEAVSTAAEITIVFHRNTEALSTVTVELIPYNENYYQVAVNSGTPFMVLDIGDVESLIATLFEE